MAELEIIDSSGNKELIKIKDIKNPDKDIYDYCLFNKYDYNKVKDLKNQFKKKYKINSISHNNNISYNSFRNLSKRSSSETYRRNKNYLFPFQIIISKPRNFDKEEYEKKFEKIVLNIKNKNNDFKENKKLNKFKKSKSQKKINYGDILYNKGKKFNKEKEEKIKNLKNQILEEEKIKGFIYFPKTNLISERALKKRKEKNLEFNNPEIINNYSVYKENFIQNAKKKKLKDFYIKNKNETFHPLINKKSQNIKNNFSNIYEKLYFDRKIKEEHLKQLEEKEKNIYSFRPELNGQYKLDNPNNSIFQKYQNLILNPEELNTQNLTQQ